MDPSSWHTIIIIPMDYIPHVALKNFDSDNYRNAPACYLLCVVYGDMVSELLMEASIATPEHEHSRQSTV